MKAIRWSKPFSRRYQQRIAKDERLTEEFWASIETFWVDPESVHDHPLENVMEGQRAFSINQEYRVVYIEKADAYVFLDVGTHAQVYRR